MRPPLNSFTYTLQTQIQNLKRPKSGICCVSCIFIIDLMLTLLHGITHLTDLNMHHWVFMKSREGLQYTKTEPTTLELSLTECQKPNR